MKDNSMDISKEESMNDVDGYLCTEYRTDYRRAPKYNSTEKICLNHAKQVIILLYTIYRIGDI